jgi:exosortase/archaeosortase family protein
MLPDSDCYLKSLFIFMSNATAKTKNTIPTKVVSSAIELYSKKYKTPANTNIMMATKTSFRNFLIYVSLAITIILIVYYLPNYYFLESTIAFHSSALLSFIGLQAPVRFVDGFAFVGNYVVVRDCTGIQVMAVFLGLILPLQRVSWIKKGISLSLLGGLLYGSNLFRVVLEYYLVDANILPWSIAHYPLSLVLGILGVFFLVLVNNMVIPEFGQYIFSLVECFEDLFKRRKANF